MIQPIIVPMQQQEARCPNCKEIENIKKVCANCGHEYLQSENMFSILCFIILITVFVIWFAGTIITCISGATVGEETTLLQVIISQIEFLKNLNLW